MVRVDSGRQRAPVLLRGIKPDWRGVCVRLRGESVARVERVSRIYIKGHNARVCRSLGAHVDRHALRVQAGAHVDV